MVSSKIIPIFFPAGKITGFYLIDHFLLISNAKLFLIFGLTEKIRK